MSIAVTPVFFFSGAAVATNSCMQRSPCGTGRMCFTRLSR